MLIAGIDEAGRGPVIGPIVMSIACIKKEHEHKLKELGVKDSKLLTLEKREFLFDKVKELCQTHTIITYPKEIDEHVMKNQLNILEAKVTAKLIDKLNPAADEAIADAPTKSTQKYQQLLQDMITADTKVIAENKADLNHVIVGAASIIAKVTRDNEIQKLKEECGVDFGSGYPADPKTKAFVQKYYNKYDFFRKSWQTYKNAAQGIQTSLSNFSTKQKEPKWVKELLKKGFMKVETKGNAEKLRLKKDKDATITLYNNGKVLVQGNKKWEQFTK